MNNKEPKLMRVLTSSKITNLDLHGETVQSKIGHGHLSSEHLQRLQEDHDHHQRCRSTLHKLLTKHGIAAVEVRRGMYWPSMQGIDAVITVGGDGTLLEASHHITSSTIPLIGLRSSPMSVGYLCYRSEDGIEEMIEQLAAGRLPIVMTPRLQASIKRVDTGLTITSVPVLNDLLYTNSSPSATSRYKLSFAGQSELQRSSGIWLATPAGSTGAIYAAGGKQVPLKSKLFQFAVRELHRIGEAGSKVLERGFFEPGVTPLRIENHCIKALLALDGHQGVIELGYGDVVTLQKAQALQLVSELP